MTSSAAVIDLNAIRHNIAVLDRSVGTARVCAVVKAGGYGHGAVEVAQAALDGGAAMVAVARLHEARQLRVAGIEAPVLVLSEVLADDIDGALTMGLELVVYRAETITAIAARAASLQVPRVAVHLKVDTGMRRVGCEPADAVARARLIVDAPTLALAGTMTHLATADEADPTTTNHQLDRFDAVLADLHQAGITPGVRHAANSAGAVAHPRAHYDMVRVGISTYGIPPSPHLSPTDYPVLADLRPALRWTAPVSLVKTVAAGDKVSYGHRYEFPHASVVATVPVGYADGVPRGLGLAGGHVLIGNQRRPIVGVVTMDQLLVDCGPDSTIAVGDEVVLLGAQGGELVSPDDWAARGETISYEIVCGIGARVERRYS